MKLKFLALPVFLLCSPVYGLSQVVYTRVGEIPRTGGQFPLYKADNGLSNIPEGCLGQHSKMLSGSVTAHQNHAPTQELRLKDGRSILGNSSGGVWLERGGQEVGRLRTPPSLSSSFQNGRLGRTAHVGFIKEMTLLPDQKTLITIANDNTLKVWNIDKQKLLHTFVGGRQVCVIKNDFAVLRLARAVHPALELWDFLEYKRVWSAPALADGARLPIHTVTATDLQTNAQTVSLATGKQLGFRRNASTVVFSPDNKWIVLNNNWDNEGYAPLGAELADGTGKVKQQIILPSSAGQPERRSLAFAFSPRSDYITINEQTYGHLIVETILNSSKDINYSLTKHKIVRRWKNTSCPTLMTGYSILGQYQIGHDVRTLYDGGRLLYYVKGNKLTSIPPISDMNQSYGQEAPLSDTIIFNVNGKPSTFDYDTKNFFTIKNNCEIYDTEKRSPSLILQWPKSANLESSDNQISVVASRRFAVVNLHSGQYVFSLADGKYIPMPGDVYGTMLHFYNINTVIQTDFRATILSQKKMLEGKIAGQPDSYIWDNMNKLKIVGFSPDNQYVAIAKSDVENSQSPLDWKIDIYKISLH